MRIVLRILAIWTALSLLTLKLWSWLMRANKRYEFPGDDEQ